MTLILCTQAQETPRKREMRGTWIATFANIDWPTRTQTPAQQRSALISILDHHKATGINTIYMQVRSQCDAMYQSSIEPWSADLNGVQGRAPSPLWDPMQFAIDECRKRGMEFHAWINPYRAVSSAGNLPGFAANHIAKVHPEWLLNNGTTLTLDPGIPAVRDYIISVITDILQRYDVDGIHFDDYFYPPGTFNDNASFNADPRGFTVRADWRRDNVNILIQRVYQTVKDLKPWVKFGVSPSGIYRNSTNPAIGTNTSGSEHYNAVFADSKKWLEQGWVDYIEPQVYWYMGQPGANYTIIVPWWNNNANGRHIYIGMAGYKVNDGTQGTPWLNPSMIPNEVRLNRGNPNVYGQAIYNTSSLRSTTKLGFRDSLRLNFYQKPSLQPTMPWRDNTPPLPATTLTATRYSDDSVVLNWTKPPFTTNELDKAKRFVVYRSQNAAINIDDANNILVITVNDTSAFNDKNIQPNTTYYYTVTSIDRFHNESVESNIVADIPPSVTCPGNQLLELDAACAATLPDYTGQASVQHASNISQSPAPGTLVASGIVPVTITATNDAGETASCTFEVNVVDHTPPVIAAPVGAGETATFSTDQGLCSFTPGHSLDISATDNCSSSLLFSYTLTYNGVTSPIVYSSTLSGTTFNKGKTFIEWVVRDQTGNTSTINYFVEVTDQEEPVITHCPSNLNSGTDPGVCVATLNVGLPEVTDNCGSVNIVGVRSDRRPLNASYPKGITTITWNVEDASGNSTSCIQTITVQDNEPPVITNAAADPSSLFPPNHKMKKININYSVQDNCGPVTTYLTVTSNEPQDGTGDGDTDSDWEILDDQHVKLRAERSGSGNGRIYTVTIHATDESGNTTTQNVLVTVPHDHSAVTKAGMMNDPGETESDFIVTVSPNPTRGSFVVSVKSKSTIPVQITVRDVTGRIIGSEKNVSPQSTMLIGEHYAPGVYMIEVLQGKDKKVTKLLKQ